MPRQTLWSISRRTGFDSRRPNSVAQGALFSFVEKQQLVLHRVGFYPRCQLQVHRCICPSRESAFGIDSQLNSSLCIGAAKVKGNSDVVHGVHPLVMERISLEARRFGFDPQRPNSVGRDDLFFSQKRTRKLAKSPSFQSKCSEIHPHCAGEVQRYIPVQV
jgi:hypothetical protein